MSTPRTQDVTSTRSIPTGRYRLDPVRSVVAFEARKLGLFTIRGTVGVAAGEFTVADPPQGSSVRATLSAGTFRTPMKKRDRHVKGPTLLDVARYPVIEFRSTQVVPGGVGWEVRGVLSVHGREHDATLTVERLAHEDGVVMVDANAQVDRREFGVTAMRAAASSVVKVRIAAVGVPLS